MAVSRPLCRLLRVLEIEEEQSRMALESALGELRRLERALAAAAERDRGGRRLVALSARTGELPDRLAGLEETRSAMRRLAALRPKIAEMELVVGALRQEFLSKRVDRRQAETLIREAEAKEAIEAGRRGQQSLDDWHLNRLHLIAKESEPAKGAATADDRPDNASLAGNT
jgi:hypothetical protein